MNNSLPALAFQFLQTTPIVLPFIMFFAALILMLVLGNPMIRWLRGKKWRQDAETWTVREDTPDTHQAKQGTPSMGGLGIIGAATATFLSLLVFFWGVPFWLFRSIFFVRLSGFGWVHALGALLLLPLFVAAHMGLGFADDWSKASGGGGLRARSKFIAQWLLAAGFLGAWLGLMATQSYLGIRFIPSALLLHSRPLFALEIVALLLVIVGTGNAVNLTDGIDGLAAGLAVQTGFALLLAGWNQLFEITYFSDLFWMALAGACCGFLWFNKFPAKVFMGDTGSLALGAALGLGAILSHAVFLLPFIGFIFYVEMFSVMGQVAYFKWTKRKFGEGRRILRRAPLHHHFELGGWSEWRVVGAFWLINLFVAALGLLLWSFELIPRWP